MRNTITMTDDQLIVEPQGLDKMWSFTGRLAIPWDHVRGATHDPGMKHEPKGWRGPGLRVGQKLSGTFHADGSRQFWNVNGYENAIVVELVDEPYSRLVISVDDPSATAARINARTSGR
ncbi:hypothetical protein [Acidipropionibacterium timonense]|uniref:hypothetical protein n=1 Tax=Acidipropionibacterium timonense TaxID=2161818 RepID=UPI00102FA576|nr:hypothetical protein [Acidipropionibacterium timonense]